jgi:hypothetical protein
MNSKKIWVLKTTDGNLKHGKKEENYTVHLFEDNDIIGVVMDTKKGELTFWINGVN